MPVLPLRALPPRRRAPLRPRAVAAALLGLLCAASPGLSQTAAPKPPSAQLIAQNGAWRLGAATFGDTGAAACFAGSSDQRQQLFEYFTYNFGATMIRLRLEEFDGLENRTEVGVLLKIDDQDPVGLRGQIANGMALLPLDPESEGKRKLVRDIADGRKLQVMDAAQKVFATYSLRGARQVLLRYPYCMSRLPKATEALKRRLSEGGDPAG